ncbi:hypothetical protein O3G_MSEX009991 [Manduca sexta]|uniref:Insulin-like domain-containing protein n=1 Tax=Manduca sexta TaxID=7130 RepID=A0A922CSL0_MANSE|nr:hypothetical protein O3G_MSEX009991 [Manduca sexta]KAG6456847.1 hypothetical protein O3G_MSEX009991 [Manduca sexta]
MRFVAVLLLLCLCGVYSERHVYCGRRLADTLMLLCDSDYLMKRSLDHEGPGWWWPAQRARALGRGKRDGIADECCVKPCSIEELLSYC